MPASIPSMLETPVRGILLADEITRHEVGLFRAVSTPGHLLHLVESGLVHQQAEGRVEVLRPGALVWYHQDEPVEGNILRAPWRFITVGFLAPQLPPPPDDRRVVRASARVVRAMRQLLEAWRDESPGPTARALRCMGLLHEILVEVASVSASSAGVKLEHQPLAARWWKAEKLVRQQLDQPLRLADIARLAGLGERTAIRACVAATGLPPARRLKMVRLHHARNLLQLTDLPITEIALATGYERVQELSRDMHKHFGQTPRAVRAAG